MHWRISAAAVGSPIEVLMVVAWIKRTVGAPVVSRAFSVLGFVFWMRMSMSELSRRGVDAAAGAVVAFDAGNDGNWS